MPTTTTTSTGRTPSGSAADTRIRARFAGRVRTAITRAASHGTLAFF
jgi:hypothetical protein